MCAENLLCAGPRTRRPLTTQALSTELISEHVDSSWRFGGGRDRQVLIYLGLQDLLLKHRKCRVLRELLQDLSTKPSGISSVEPVPISTRPQPTIGAFVSIYHKAEHMREAGPWLAASRSTYVQLQKAPSSKEVFQGWPVAAPGSLGTCPSPDWP